jgi:hypothetical protein
MSDDPQKSPPLGRLEAFRAMLMNALSARPLSIGLMVAAFALALSGPATAHGRLGAAEGRCRLFIGPDTMNFTGYLPDASKVEFCEDIPATGHVIVALDDIQEELRDMKVEIRVVRDVGGPAKEEENLDAVTVAHVEPRYYPTGTITFEHTFDEPGYFVGIVTAIGDHGERWTSRFPFSVDKSFARTLPIYLLLGAAVIALYFIYLRHRHELAPKKVATRSPPRDPTPTPPPAPAE